MHQLTQRRRIAIVGGGVAGLSAAYVLQKAHDVTLYEASDTLGGHAHAVAVDDGRGGAIEVDTAFLIYNELCYPSFVALLGSLGVADRTRSAEMSACFADHDKGVHYALGRGAGALFHERKNLVDPRFYRIFVELLAFRRRAHGDLLAGRLREETTLSEYLAPYSSLFRENRAPGPRSTRPRPPSRSDRGGASPGARRERDRIALGPPYRASPGSALNRCRARSQQRRTSLREEASRALGGAENEGDSLARCAAFEVA